MDSITIRYSLPELPQTIAQFKHLLDSTVLKSSAAVIVALEGDLGAGKTAFVQELARQYGVVEAVTSPTFVVMRTYEIVNQELCALVHIDAYRIENEEELQVLKIEEILHTPKTVVCIEWPQQIPQTLGTRPRFTVCITTISEDVREIKIKYSTV